MKRHWMRDSRGSLNATVSGAAMFADVFVCVPDPLVLVEINHYDPTKFLGVSEQ